MCVYFRVFDVELYLFGRMASYSSYSPLVIVLVRSFTESQPHQVFMPHIVQRIIRNVLLYEILSMTQ